jgi:hypothetical protein
VDENDRWIGGDLVVVQTGDQLDRGDEEQAILDLFARLAREAARAGGAVHSLIGNHEVMNAALDLRYVTPGGYADFQDAVLIDSTTTGVEVRCPPGAIAALRPGGRTRCSPAQRRPSRRQRIVHGGVLPSTSSTADRINAEVRLLLLGKGPSPTRLLERGSVVWARNYSDEVDDADCATLSEVLEALSAKRMIVGHTVQEGGIRFYCDGQVWCIDVGMSAHYGGDVQVLEILGDSLRVLGPVQGESP